MSGTTIRVAFPGRLADFMEGGEAWLTYKRTGTTGPNLDADELALFQAVNAGRIVRPSKGGYYVIVHLTPGAVEAARYWAETLASSSGDDAAWDQDARNDLRAAERILRQLPSQPPRRVGIVVVPKAGQ